MDSRGTTGVSEALIIDLSGLLAKKPGFFFFRARNRVSKFRERTTWLDLFNIQIMNLIVNGFLTDHQSRILLQKIAEQSLAPVGHDVETGILPAQTLARAFREQTGLLVMPVRLTGLYYSGRGGGRLSFSFRCTMRGGDLDMPDGQPPAGFFDGTPLPGGLSSNHRQQLDGALHHAGGPPLMVRQDTGVGAWLGRLVGRADLAPESTHWDVSVQNRDATEESVVEWSLVDALPQQATPVESGEAPWETAARLPGASRPKVHGPLVRLARVEIATGRPAMTLVFAPAS